MLLTPLVGLVELFRETDERRYFEAVDAADGDMVNNYLYITGSASVGEYFGDPVLPNDGANEIGDLCDYGLDKFVPAASPSNRGREVLRAG